MIVTVGRSLFIRVLQIVECVRVDSISSGHLPRFEFHVFGKCVVLESHYCIDPEFLKRHVQTSD